jgi:2,3-bisphosphoglycerate-independent phosphoglycerate mutase
MDYDIHLLTRELQQSNNSKIVMLVADGLGGLPMEPGGQTELESAHTPELDRLAARGVQGGSIPVLPGISPGSGPGHLALFGYDPLRYQIGRGALEATGMNWNYGTEMWPLAEISVRWIARDASVIAAPGGSPRRPVRHWPLV